jgi:hypothetical protein
MADSVASSGTTIGADLRQADVNDRPDCHRFELHDWVTPMTTDASTILARYVFVDIVGFTRERSVEAQADLVATLNGLIRSGLERLQDIDPRSILLPTGDGVCVALLGGDLPYDLHLKFAVGLLADLYHYNARQPDVMRRFALRIGVNQNIDNLVTDVNGNRNVAGAGISGAQRIMDFADASQILVSQAVFDVLQSREAYMKQFRAYSGVAKHNTRMAVYQYIRHGTPGLDTAVPTSFASTATAQKISAVAAYYMALCMKYHEFLLSRTGDPAFEFAACVWLWFRACDARGIEANEKPRTWGAPTSMDEAQYQHYADIDSWTLLELKNRIVAQEFAGLDRCFADGSVVFLSDEGERRLAEEHPDAVNSIVKVA